MGKYDEYTKKIKDWALKQGLEFIMDWAKSKFEKWKDKKAEKSWEKSKEEMVVDKVVVKVPEPLKVTWIPSPNISSRNEAEIDAIILHHTGDSIQSALSWMKMKDSKVSYHYLIAKNGDIYQMVKEGDKAWHAGTSLMQGRGNVNAFSLGIAFEGDGTGSVPYTDEQYQNAANLCKLLKIKYPKITNSRIASHASIALPAGRKNDPSSGFDWHRFFSLIDK
jgi:N-acetyl-anhydromuramyl-L-alanine amidase AmpD